MTQLLYSDLTYYLRGVAFRIHNTLKGAHDERTFERTFERALIAALAADGISFQIQPKYWVWYKDHQVGEYRPDLTLADG